MVGGKGMAGQTTTVYKDYEKPFGRPTTYTPKRADELLEIMRQGYSISATAVKMDIDPAKLYDWVKQHKDFAKAFARGKELQKLFYEDKGLQNLTNRNFNAPLFKFMSGQMLGWYEKQEIKQETTVTVTVQHQLANEVIESLPDYAQPLVITVEKEKEPKKE